MIEPLVRILLRYLAVPVLLWLGTPAETAHQIINDPDIRLMLIAGVPLIAASIEGWWVWARRRGRPT